MKNNSKFSNFLLFLAVMSGIFWLGSYFTRLIITFQLFEPTGFVLKTAFQNQNLEPVILVISSSISVTFISYIILVLSFTLFMIFSNIKLKVNGWLFIIMLILIITAPFELFLMSYDYKILTTVFMNNAETHNILPLIIKRLKILNSFPLIEIFSYIGIIALFIFKPLKREL